MPRQAPSLHLHAGEVVGDAAFTYDSSSSSNLFISDLCQLALVILMIMVPWYYVLYDQPPEFSVVQLEPIGINRLNNKSSSSSGSGPPAASASSPDGHGFRARLHASNRRATERCYHHGDGAVLYAGFTVASAGRALGRFCVPGKGQREVPLLLLLAARKDDAGGAGAAAGGVVGLMGPLPEHLRDRAADETAKTGALELEVQIMLFQRDGRPSRTRMWCTARVGGSSAQPPPETAAMCTVFALQDWFDFSA